jgi:CheY-like chemotaxis protein
METNYILVIDDSNTNVVLLDAILSTRGYEIKTALSVKEAMELVKKKVPDLILLDLLMPEISGFDFLKNIHINDQLRDVPVVVISALADESNISTCKELGAAGFIKKPVDIAVLVNTVEKILTK